MFAVVLAAVAETLQQIFQPQLQYLLELGC